MPDFLRYVGISYSGAEVPTSSLKNLRVYLGEGDSPPAEVLPPPGPKIYWTRKGIAHWLVERLAEEAPTLVGINHGFSFPLRYFEVHHLELDWPSFLDDFQRHWPTDNDHTYVVSMLEEAIGNAAARLGRPRWRRLTEKQVRGARSVFDFRALGQVATATHAGLPWLRFIRQELGGRVRFWPFDGWDIPCGASAIAEVRPALWSRRFIREGRTLHQHNAYCAAAWLSRADRDGSLAAFLAPPLRESQRTVASVEGWILGVPDSLTVWPPATRADC